MGKPDYPPASFSPNMLSYTGQGSFRYWCQTALPLVYDDSLSYYELLNKVVNYLNNVITDVSNAETNINSLLEAYNSLQNYVNKYFDSIDIQDEINTKLNIMAEDGTLTNLMSPFIPDLVTDWLDNNITPTTPPIDKTLRVDNAAANSLTVGNEFINVNNKIDSITEKTSNLFNAFAIELGKNSTGASPYPKRALSNAMNVGTNSAKIRVVNIPNNIKFEIERYANENASSYAGFDSVNGWIQSQGNYSYGYSNPYIRFLFAKVDNSDLTIEDLNGIKISVNAGLVFHDYEECLNPVDVKNRKFTDAILKTKNDFGLLPISGYEQVAINAAGNQVYSSTRISTSDFIEVIPYGILFAKKYETNDYNISVTVYNENRTRIRSSNYVDLYTAGYKLTGSAKYIKITITKTDFSDIYPEEANNVNTRLFYMGFSTNKTNLRVMTFNVGNWNYGVSPHGIDSSIYDEKIVNYRRFFGEQNCDIVGLQEAERLIDRAGTIDYRTAIFNHWYNYSEISGNWESIITKYNISAGGHSTIVNDRTYVYTYMQFEDKIIYLLNVHLSPGHTDADKVKRNDEVTAVLNLLTGKEYFILFGDFNPEPDEYKNLFKRFSDAGYNVANSDFFGDFWTWSTNANDFNAEEPSGTVFVIDNVITSNNIKINSVNKINTYSELTSDHIPITADLYVE